MPKNINAGGKRVVAIGGGTGLSNLLRVLKELTGNLTAVVAMTDNGGSSGKLREEFGMLPPGDVRSCILALSHSELEMGRLLAYRFPEEGTLSGHTVGNILLAAIMQVENVDFAEAAARLSALLAITGRVLPATTDNVTLGAVLEDGEVICGETEIAADRRAIKRLFLRPADCRPLPDVLQAITEADYIFIGPGSIYSSLISNLLLPGLAEALAESPAKICYLANMATEPAELARAEMSMYWRLLEEYFARAGCTGRLVDVIIANNGVYSAEALAVLAQKQSRPVVCDAAELALSPVRLITADLVDEVNFWQHNRDKLLPVLKNLLAE